MKMKNMNETKILKCSKCRKFVDVPESYMKKVCPSCLDKLRRAYQKTKEFKPSKLDIAERDKLESERQQELIERFGVSNENCIKFRLQETNKDRGSEWFNHVENCHECRKWMKNQGCDLNASSKKFAELKGYEEMFKDSNSAPSNMGENRQGWINICSTCGTPLNKDGSCPLCSRGCE
jgi:predicted RNA-binding Zn-ribbon protein involved in translation (DUF1610 family)